MDNTLVYGDTDTKSRLADGDPTVKFLLPVSDSRMDLEWESFWLTHGLGMREILKIA